MDLTLTPDDIAFRDEVRAFLDENITDDIRRAMKLTTGFLNEPGIALDFHKALNAKGWAAPNWPEEYGGPGWTRCSAISTNLNAREPGRPATTDRAPITSGRS